MINLCGQPGWRPPAGSFRRRTLTLYERALLGSCRAWVKGDYRASMSKIAKAAGYELSLRDMGMSGNLDEAPVPSWISDLGADSAAYAPFEVFQRRLKSKTYIELDASLKRLETYAGGVK